MVIKLLLILLPINIYAQLNKGVVIVLEAPLFHDKDEESKVVQYLRKGEEIYIHPSEFNTKKFNSISQKISDKKIIQYTKEHNDRYPDEFLGKTSFTLTEDDSQFIKTKDNRGHIAYVLRHHVHVYYRSEKEFNQDVKDYDETDYRIDEPLSDNYPFYTENKNRSLITFGLGPQNESHYAYVEEIQNKGYSFRRNFGLHWYKNWKQFKNPRLFWGISALFSSTESDLSLPSYRAKESYLKFGLGPSISYDQWKSETLTFNTSTSVIVNIWDQVEIDTFDRATGLNSEALFSRFSINPHITFTLSKKNIFKNVDLAIGSNIELFLPNKYATKSTSIIPGLFPSHQFEKEFHAEINFFIGIQSKSF